MEQTKLFQGLLVAILLLCSLSANAYDFRTDGIFYNILSENDLTCEVTGRYYNSSSNKDSYEGEVVIPETTSYLGKTYSVVAIGNYAFYNCSSLTKITSLNQKPPSCTSSAFSSVPTSTCVLYVPLGATKAYSEADVWKNFYNIEEIDTSGIESVSTSSYNAEVTGYYTLDGKAVDAPQRGINIVKYSDGSTKKVMMK